MGYANERGYRVRDYQEEFDGAVSKCYIAYALDSIDGNTGRTWKNPDDFLVITRLTIQTGPGTGTGTIQFFREHVETDAISPMSNEIVLDETQSHYTVPVEWLPGALNDVYFTTTGTARAVVSLHTHEVRGSYSSPLDINL